MEPSEARRGIEAARSTAAALGLRAEDAVVVHDGGRIAVRLTPCEVLARVAPSSWAPGLQFEADVARRLTEAGSPVGELEPRVEPRVYLRDDFAITLWTYYEPRARSAEHVNISAAVEAFTDAHIAPADYANALGRLHAGLRQIDQEAPHISDRVAGWSANLGDRTVTPELLESDRDLLTATLSRVATAMSRWGTGDQLLHGEPHPGNVLNTTRGPLFIDLHTCQRGPVEYDLSYVPEDVAAHYPGANQDLVEKFRILMWAGVTSTRWCRDDQFPNRDYWRIEGLKQLRAALARHRLD